MELNLSKGQDIHRTTTVAILRNHIRTNTISSSICIPASPHLYVDEGYGFLTNLEKSKNFATTHILCKINLDIHEF
jgi:hypothetical protein